MKGGSLSTDRPPPQQSTALRAGGVRSDLQRTKHKNGLCRPGHSWARFIPACRMHLQPDPYHGDGCARGQVIFSAGQAEDGVPPPAHPPNQQTTQEHFVTRTPNHQPTSNRPTDQPTPRSTSW
jgi:hypothetical protein